MTSQIYDWQVAVFCHNEERRIGACIDAIDAAMGTRKGLITVLVNGSTDRSRRVAERAAVRAKSAVQVISLPIADKSYTINSFLYGYRADASLYFCVDGYVLIDPHALTAMAARMWADGVAVAASGRALNGRTEAALTRSTLAEGGAIRGGFYCLRPSFVERIVNAGLRLPVGLYRGDGLLGSMATHDLDPVNLQRDPRLVLGVSEATYQIDSLSTFRPRDILRQFRRMVRQMRGKLENAAIKQIVHTAGFGALPLYADDMIADYLTRHPVPSVRLVDAPFMAMALRQVRRGRFSGRRGLMPPAETGHHPLARRPMKHRQPAHR